MHRDAKGPNMNDVITTLSNAAATLQCATDRLYELSRHAGTRAELQASQDLIMTKRIPLFSKIAAHCRKQLPLLSQDQPTLDEETPRMLCHEMSHALESAIEWTGVAMNVPPVQRSLHVLSENPVFLKTVGAVATPLLAGVHYVWPRLGIYQRYEQLEFAQQALADMKVRVEECCGRYELGRSHGGSRQEVEAIRIALHELELRTGF